MICSECGAAMHVLFTYKENRHFLCVVDGTKTVEPKAAREMKKGRPPAGGNRPKRIRAEGKPKPEVEGVRTHRAR